MFDIINNAFMWFTKLGSNGILAVALLIIGLLVGLGISGAIRASLTATVGFVGLNLVVGMLTDSMGAATSAMVERLGWNLDIVDIGWGLMGISWSSPVVGLCVFAIILANIIFLLLKVTNTLMVDFWNYWSYLACAAILYGATMNPILSVAGAVIYALISWIWADRMAPKFQEFYGIPGCSWPTGAVIAPGMIAIPILKLVQRIPIIKDINADPETIQDKLGIFGEPVVIGCILGLVIGFAANYDFVGIFTLGINMAAVMILLPRMIQIMMEGLIAISDAAQIKTREIFKDREIYIGIDASTIMGNPATMSAILIMTPIVTIMSVIPGNRMLATASLAAVPWFIIPITAHAKENVLHICIAAFVVFCIYFWGATALAGAHTAAGELTGYDTGGGLISSLSEGGNPITWVIHTVYKFLGFATV